MYKWFKTVEFKSWGAYCKEAYINKLLCYLSRKNIACHLFV